MIFLRPPSVGGPVIHDGTFITQGTTAVTITAPVPSASARTGQVAILTIVSRQNSGNIVLNTSGWTQLNAGGQGNSNQAAMWWKRIVGDETTITATIPNMNTSGGWVVRLDFFSNAGLVTPGWAPIVSTNAVTSKVFQNSVSTMPGSFTLMCATGQTATGGAWTTMTPALDSAGSDAQNYDTGAGRVWISAWKKGEQPIEVLSDFTASGASGYVQLFPVTITPLIATNLPPGQHKVSIAANVDSTNGVPFDFTNFVQTSGEWGDSSGFKFTAPGYGKIEGTIASTFANTGGRAFIPLNGMEALTVSWSAFQSKPKLITPAFGFTEGMSVGLRVLTSGNVTWTTSTNMLFTVD